MVTAVAMTEIQRIAVMIIEGLLLQVDHHELYFNFFVQHFRKGSIVK